MLKANIMQTVENSLGQIIPKAAITLVRFPQNCQDVAIIDMRSANLTAGLDGQMAVTSVKTSAYADYCD